MSGVTEYDFIEEAVIEGELQLFRTLWHASNDNLFIVKRDEEGNYINEKCNRSMELTFNLSPGQVDGVSIEDILDKTTFERIKVRYDRCIKTNKPISYEEKHIIDDSGERYWITTIVPSRCKDSGTVRVFGISKEVTKIRNIEKKLKETNDKLEHQVEERTKELREALEKMKKLSATDTLTDLHNRYKIEEILQNEINRAKRYDGCFGLLILDIDYFKEINDKYGHIQGDKVLQEFADVLRANTRETDSIGRWGGEEFLIVIPESSEELINKFADKIRRAIEQHSFKNIGKITVSIGTTLYKISSTVQSMIFKADSALYVSKNSGRNSVNSAS